MRQSHVPRLQARSRPLLLSSVDPWSPVACEGNTLLRLDTEGQESFLLSIEAEEARDPRKTAHWAHHVSHLWAQHQLPTALLITCCDQDTARWAEQPVSSGPVQPPALTLHPFVAGPHNLPLITDLDKARADPALAALSAIMHPADRGIGPALDALSTALRDLPGVLAYPLIAVTADGLHQHAAQALWKHLVSSIILERDREKDRVERLTKFRKEHLLILRGSTGCFSPRASAGRSRTVRMPSSSSAGSSALSPRPPWRRSSTTSEPNHRLTESTGRPASPAPSRPGPACRSRSTSQERHARPGPPCPRRSPPPPPCATGTGRAAPR